ncbi:MAG: TIGR03936 family radical SAM-associated protein [Anaerolineae bacterium]|nr:TIGR03936 family radical SAM-associated protein [Anaerolineae bacterium]
MRIRLTFSKTEAMRFTGHLDLQRTLERTIRRANLPLAYSEGYHPHPKLALAAALPLGFTSNGEVADMWLKEEIALKDVEAALKNASPPGVVFDNVEQIELDKPKIQTMLKSAEYLVTLPEPIPGLEQRVADLLAAEAIPYTRTRKRKSKDIDMRPLIEELAVEEPGEDGRPRLGMRLAAREGATGRPDEVLGVLGVKAATAAIDRTDLLFAAE